MHIWTFESKKFFTKKWGECLWVAVLTVVTGCHHRCVSFHFHTSQRAHINETIIFELCQLRHRVETIGLAHSLYHVLTPMTGQDIRSGPTKSQMLTNCANSLVPIKYRIKTRFLSIHDVNLKSYWGNIVPMTACLLDLGWCNSLGCLGNGSKFGSRTGGRLTFGKYNLNFLNTCSLPNQTLPKLTIRNST